MNLIRRTMAGLILFYIHVAAYGQGTVSFDNAQGALISTNSVPGGPATGLISGPAGSYFFALFSAPYGTTDPALFTFTGAYAENYAPVSGGVVAGTVPIPGTQPGEMISLLVRGWSANIGTTYSDVTNYLASPSFDAWYAESQIGAVILGDDFPQAEIIFGPPPRIPAFVLDMHTSGKTLVLGPPQLNTNGIFAFNVSGPTGAVCSVEASIDLLSWSSMTNVVLTNGTATVQTSATNSALQFYRAKFPSN